MPEKYINDPHLQIAMTEYQPNMKKNKYEVNTQYNQNIGYVTQVFDNTHRSRRAGLCSCKKSQRKC